MFIRGQSPYELVWAAEDGGAAPAADPAAVVPPAVDPPSGGGAAEGGAGVAPGDPPTGQEGGDGGKPAPSPAPKGTDWRERRLAQKTAQVEELRRKLQQYEQPAAGQVETPPAAAADTVPASEVERRARELAAQIAAGQDFTNRCNAAFEAGVEAFGREQFVSSANQLRQLADPSDPGSIGAYNAFLEAAIETGEGPRVLFELGKNMDEASRLMALPPVRMATQLAKFASKLGQESAAEGNRLTGAPKPIVPVSNRGGVREVIDPGDKDRSDAIDTKTWMARREEQLAARRTG